MFKHRHSDASLLNLPDLTSKNLIVVLRKLLSSSNFISLSSLTGAFAPPTVLFGLQNPSSLNLWANLMPQRWVRLGRSHLRVSFYNVTVMTV